MKVTVKTINAEAAKADLLVVLLPAPKDDERPRLPRGLGALDAKLGHVVQAAVSSGDLKGRKLERLVVYPTADAAVKRVLLIGTGPTDEIDAERLRQIGALASSTARDQEHARVTILGRRGKGMDVAESASALAEGAILGAYRFDGFQAAGRARGRKATSPRALDLVFDTAEGIARVRRRVADAVIGAECQIRARDLSNAPPNEMHPLGLATAARTAAREAGLVCRVIRGKELSRRGLGALLAVGSGSANPPCLVILEHKGRSRGRGAGRGPICLVGKGITFDSGGLSLKSAAPMLDMKHDMSGAATVIATMRGVGLLDHPDHVVGVIAAAENMPSGTAYRPSDILTSGSGKTIEVVNTDAEGRLVLADALHHAIETQAPRVIIDVATLTGAAMVALGQWATAVLGTDERLIEALRAAGDAAGERVWPLPLLPEHTAAIKSSVADIKNSGGPHAGASTAGAFLREFVGDTPWAHLDIAGTGWSTSNGPTHRGGATGVGVRMLLHWLRDGVQPFD